MGLAGFRAAQRRPGAVLVKPARRSAATAVLRTAAMTCADDPARSRWASSFMVVSRTWCRACATRRRIDARGMQDLPPGGRRFGDAEFRQFAVDPAVSPQRILLRQPNDQAGDARDCWRTAGLPPPARVVLSPRQFAVPGQQRRGRNRQDFGPAPAGDEPCQRGEPHPVSWLVPDPADVAEQNRVLVPKHQQFSILRQVLTEYQDGQAK